ncbi:response regulator [Ectothiorhodospiraceae bacterium WFHF3C12]|nr:response regulator [Ectothiorhodospiraceae bacterium WFHF3C12]
MATILWVEDQSHWIDRFRPVLEAAEFDEGPTELQVFRFAEAACQHIKASNPANRPDVALLDANMKGNTAAGFSVSRALQRKWPDVPILYLSEYSGTDVEQQALESAWAQDFIAKHQRNVESVLCWRIRATLRQARMRQPGQPDPGDVLQSGDLRIDTASWTIYWRGEKLMNPADSRRPLAPTPRRILRYLVEASPRAVTTERMAELLDADPDRFTWASYRQHVRVLRRAFDQAMPGEGAFTALCKTDQGIVAFGDSMAYCWKPVQRDAS